MTLVLELPPDLLRDLAAEAERLHLPIEEYALRLLATGRPADLPKTGAEVVSNWQREGLIGTRPDIADSQAHARALRERAEKRSRS